MKRLFLSLLFLSGCSAPSINDVNTAPGGPSTASGITYMECAIECRGLGGVKIYKSGFCRCWWD